MGWEFLGSIFEWAAGSNIVGSLVRVAAAFGLMKWVSGSQQPPSSGTSSIVNNRIQVPPATDNKIPVAYGNSYFNGTIIDVQLTNSNKTMYAAIVLCETTGNLLSTSSASNIVIDNIYLDNKKITFKADGTTVDYVTDDTGVVDSNPSGLMGIYLYKGGSAYPMLPCQPGTTTPITGTVPSAAYSIMPGWDNTYNCNNTIFAIVKLNYDQSKGQHGIPNLKFHVCNSMTLPGDCLYDYMTNGMYGANIPVGLINTTSIAALNTYSAQSVTYSPYPAQQRYTINGLISTTNKVLNNMDLIAASAASYITYDISSGQWAVLIQKITSQSFSFNDSNIIGQINATGTALDTYYNSVEVQFPYAYLRDQSNYARVDLTTAALNYNEPVNVLKVQHGLINNVVQATIIANILLRQSREDLVVVFKTDFSSYNLQIGDVFGLTNATYGFISKTFRVIKLVKTESDKGELTIEVTGLAYDDAVYTVSNISTFIPTIGAGYSIPNLGAIATPIAPTLTSSTISSQPSITVTATIPSGVVTDMEFWASSDGTTYKFQGSTRSANSGPFTTGATTQFKTVELLTATWYFKVRAANAQGTSAFSPASTGLAFTYIQAPDVLPYNTPVVNPGTTNTPSIGNMSLAILMAWGANQLFGTALSSLGGLLGLSSDQTTGLTAFQNKQVTGGITTVPGSGIIIDQAGNVSLDQTVITAVTTTCTLTFGSKYPADRSIYENPEQNTSGDRAPSDGNYWISATSPSGNALSAGTGKAYLYKSDGTLVKSVSATVSGTQVNLVFGTVTTGVDYYILMETNVVTDGTCKSLAITDPYSWNFHTADPQDVIPPTPTPPPVTPTTCPPISFIKSITYLYSYYKLATATDPIYPGQVKISPDNQKVDPESNIGLQFNQPIIFGTAGTIRIKNSFGFTVQSFDITKTFTSDKISELFWISNDTLYINPTTDLTAGSTYYINITADCIKNACNTSGNLAITDSTTVTWTVDNGTIFNT